jgi:hypothetical protein
VRLPPASLLIVRCLVAYIVVELQLTACQQVFAQVGLSSCHWALLEIEAPEGHVYSFPYGPPTRCDWARLGH